jgi:hypothetical protein
MLPSSARHVDSQVSLESAQVGFPGAPDLASVSRTTNNAGYFLVYFSIISFMTSAAVLLPFRISCIISVDGGRMWFARR